MKRVWIVDDEIPVDALYSGTYPQRLEKDVIRYLVEKHRDAWTEAHVLDLCATLCSKEFESTFFRSPESVEWTLDQGATPPDAVIFDWEYGAPNPKRNVDVLERLLGNAFTYVQIYTHLGHEGVEPHVGELREKYPDRLLPTKMKKEVRASDLAESIRSAWAGTIAGPLADEIRSQVYSAVERALIDFCNIKQDAIAAIAQSAPETFVDIVLSRIRDEIGSRAAKTLDDILAVTPAISSSPELRRLMSIWYYYFPADQIVRRGDVIEIDGAELGFVITPPCHLARFSGKTGQRLTWLRLTTFDQSGLAALRKSGLKIKDVGKSMTANLAGEALTLFPNLPLKSGSRKEFGDFALISHAWQSRDFEGTGSEEVEYTHLKGIVRRCTLADPFANAVVARVTSAMASQGTPDFPEGEFSRLTVLVKAAPIELPIQVPPAAPTDAAG
jgi:hypothetical protein